VAKLKTTSENTKEASTKMVERMTSNFVKPANEYSMKFKEIKKRMDDYASKRSDMERHQAEVNKLREKPSTASKLPAAEEKFRISQQQYEVLRQELLRELPALYNDRLPFFNHLLACLVKSHLEYYTTASQEYSATLELVADINEKDILSHAKVITPTERSFYSRNVRSDPVFIAAKTARPLPQQPGNTESPRPSPPAPVPAPAAAPVFSAPAQTAAPSVTSISATPVSASVTVSTPVVAPSAAAVAPTSAVVAASTPAPGGSGEAAGGLKAKALYTFTGEEDNELSFQKGDSLLIIKNEGEWWEGEINGVRGLLPSNYVQILPS